MRYAHILLALALSACVGPLKTSVTGLVIEKPRNGMSSIIYRIDEIKRGDLSQSYAIALIEKNEPHRILPLYQTEGYVQSIIPAGSYVVDVIDKRKLQEGQASLRYAPLHDVALNLLPNKSVYLGDMRIALDVSAITHASEIRTSHNRMVLMANLANLQGEAIDNAMLSCRFCFASQDAVPKGAH